LGIGNDLWVLAAKIGFSSDLKHTPGFRHNPM